MCPDLSCHVLPLIVLSYYGCAEAGLGENGANMKKGVRNSAASVGAYNRHVCQSTFSLAMLVALVGLLGCAGGSKLLSERLISPNDRTKRAAFAEMNGLEIGSREKYLYIVRNTLRDSNPDNRLLAVDSLGRMGPAAEVAIPDVIRLLGDEHDALRLRAEKTLAEIGSASVPHLIAALDHRSSMIRCSAADTLGIMGAKAEEAVPTLAGMLGDQDYNVSRHAASALGHIGPASVPAIIHSVRGGSGQLLEGALTSFSFLKADENIIQELVPLMRDQSENPAVRGFAAKALGKMQEKARGAIPDLAYAIGDKNNDVRSAAEWALVQMGAAAIPVLKEMCTDGNPLIRTSAVRAIGRMGPAAENAVPVLMQIMTDEDRVVRIESILALEKVQTSSRSAVKALIRIMDEDADDFVRLSAVRVLNKIGTDDAKEAVNRFNKKNSHE